MEEVFISWQAPEFEHREKGPAWYWLSMLVAIGVMALALWQKNFLFAVFVVIAEVLLVIWGDRKPIFIEMKLSREGLQIGEDKIYNYQDMESFALDQKHESEWVGMVLKFKQIIRPKIKIMLPRVDLKRIVANLSSLAPGVKEVELEESLTDTVEKIIRF